MGVEAYPFLRRVEVTHRNRIGKAVYREAFFEGKTFSIVRSGIGPDRAAGAIKSLQVRPSAILSVGTAGGLAPGLRFGHIVVSSETVSADSPDTPLAWTDWLVTAAVNACKKEGIPFIAARLATVRKPVFRREDRERLHRVTGAHAVDMESHAVGLEALRLGIPFVALRVISDDVDAPPLDDRRGFRHIWRNPSELPERFSAGFRWWRFIKKFKHAVDVLHPVLVRFLREADGSALFPGEWNTKQEE
jgi:nucleoside phosphorylase